MQCTKKFHKKIVKNVYWNNFDEKNVGLLYVGTVFLYFDEKMLKKCIQAGIVYLKRQKSCIKQLFAAEDTYLYTIPAWMHFFQHFFVKIEKKLSRHIQHVVRSYILIQLHKQVQSVLSNIPAGCSDSCRLENSLILRNLNGFIVFRL